MARMNLNIVTAERETFSGGVDYVTAPGADGELTILPSHAALISTLQPGELRFGVDGEEQAIVVTGGFFEVLADNVTVLADAAEREDEIDEERAEIAVRRAEERIAAHGGDLDMERALASLRRARMRLRFARRRRSR